MPALPSTPPRSPKATFGAALAALLLLCLPACDSDGGGDEGTGLADGTFEATTRGVVDDEVSGEAFFSVVSNDEPGEPEEPPETFQIVMLASNASGDTTVVSLARLNTETPEEGTYEIVDVEEVENSETAPRENFGALFASQAAQGLYFSRSGTVDIIRSEDDQLEGTFTFRGSEFTIFGPSPETISIEVEGAFNATRMDELPPLPQSRATLEEASRRAP